MNTFKITQKQFNDTNKSLSEFFDVPYTHIEIEENEIIFKNNGWGGKTIGTTGYKYTDEQKKNISDSLKGKQSWLGKTHTEETKQKMREIALQREERKRILKFQTLGN